MDILHHQTERGGGFYIDENGEHLAEMEYRKDGERLTIVHTGVTQKLEGQGVGKQLVAKAVEFARANGFKLAASCPFAKKVLERDDSVSDVYVH